ncbi:hypothetical protein RUND412_001953 [Rhizina undulata]
MVLPAPSTPTRTENPLSLSQRSNSLQFSGSSFFQPPLSSTHSRSIYLYTAPRNISADGGRPSKKLQSSVALNTSLPTNARPTPGGSATPPVCPHRTISSLVTPYLSAKSSKRTSKSIHRLSSSASVRSATSSILSRKRKYYYEHPKLETLPSEILDEIASYLSQPSLLALSKVSKRMYSEIADTLYVQPSFASTYRFAQFVSVVSSNPSLARMVRVLDLGSMGSHIPTDDPIAGWREWKYRTNPLHTIHRDDLETGGQKKGFIAISPTLHYSPSTFSVASYKSGPSPGRSIAKTRALIHVLAACTYIRELDLSGVPLAADYRVLRGNKDGFTPTAFTGLLFVSDVPKSFTWKEGDTESLNAATDLTNAITELKCLRSLKLVGGLWVTLDAARKLVNGCPRLQELDFTECGMCKRSPWAVQGTKEGLRAIIEEKQKKGGATSKTI